MTNGANLSRDPEGTRKQKLEKLTPAYEKEGRIYTNSPMERLDNETSRSLSSPRDELHEKTMRDFEKETTVQVHLMNKRKRTSDEVSHSRRCDSSAHGISNDVREHTVKSLIELLKPFHPPDTVPDLLARAAKLLESQMFDNLPKGRSVNALGRSSTLLTAKAKKDGTERYHKEVERLLSRVRSYVEMANRDDAELDNVQQGEVWEVIKQILDSS